MSNIRRSFTWAVVRLAARIRRLAFADNTLRSALILAGFAAFVWGLYDLAPWVAKVIGGLCLLWFAWPSSSSSEGRR